MKQHLRRVSSLAMAPVLAVGLAACSDSGSGDPTALNIEIIEPAPGQVKINAPTSSAGGTTRIVVKNSGTTSHSAQFLQVSGGKTLNDVQQFIVSTSGEEGAPIPDWIVAGGGAGAIPAGQTATVTQELEEGSWFIVDDESPEGEGAPSYAASGGITPLQVSDGGSDASLPSASVTVAAKDYSFEVDGTLKAGQNSIKFANDGKELHHLAAFPLIPGKTAADFQAFLQTEGEPTGPPPADFDGGRSTAVIAGGQSIVTDIDLKSGKYVLVCFINDRAGGPPHAIAHNMFSEVTVA